MYDKIYYFIIHGYIVQYVEYNNLLFEYRKKIKRRKREKKIRMEIERERDMKDETNKFFIITILLYFS